MSRKESVLLSLLVFILVASESSAVVCAGLKDVACGENHVLALAQDHTLWACGYGPLGISESSESILSLQQVHGPNNVGFLDDVNGFDAGLYHSIAVTNEGFAFCWGTDDYGKLGNGPSEGDSAFPTKVHGLNNVGYLENIVAVSAGRSGHHSLTIDSAGYAYAWGLNSSGQCGDGTQDPKEYPVLVKDSDPNTSGRYLGDEATIIDVDAGVNHSLGLDDQGHVWEWGANNGSSIPAKVPGENGVGALSNIVDIATCYCSLAVDSSGFVYEWDSSYPVKVNGLSNIVSVGAGNSYRLALDANGNVWQWQQSSTPVKVTNGEMQTQSGFLENIIAVDAGFHHFHIAISDDGYGWAWGSSNGNGQLGVGDTNERPEPAMMLCAEVSSSIYLTKTSEIQGSEPNCAKPFIGMGIEDNYLVYDINYGNPITDSNDPNYYGTLHEVNIVDHLAFEVNFDSASGGGQYDPNNRTVRWTVGDLDPGEEGSFTLTVKVNEYARPGGEITNFVEIRADMYYSFATDTVPVCNWGSEIIYVDKDATGFNNGTNWDDAYTDLRDAFTGAQNVGAEITAIWVAAGTYKPTYDTNQSDYRNKSFELIENVGLFGHFGGVGTYETSTSQRNLADANNQTVLDGQIGQEYYDAVYNAVKANDINSAVVDGFTIKGAYDGAGIYLDDADVSVVNCKIRGNSSYGIYAQNYSYPDIHNCFFTDNSSYAVYSDTSEPDVSYSILDGNDITSYGLYLQSGSTSNVTHSNLKNHTSSGITGFSATANITWTVFEDNDQNGIRLSSYSNLDIQNCVIRGSGYEGIRLYQNSGTKIVNNWIHKNGTAMGSSYGSGVYFGNQIGIPLVRNNTIYDNYTYGIECSQTGADPNIRNCIICGNDSNDLYRPGGGFNKVNYCLLQNTHSGAGNLTGDPCFYDADSNDLHIRSESICKNAGDPNGDYNGETDIDGENRVYYGRVDAGGDEYYFPKADYDINWIVNLPDYSKFADNWLDVNAAISLDGDSDVDIYDLDLFCVDWLWQAPWGDGWMLAMTGGGMGMGFDSSKATSSEKRPDALMLSAAESLRTRPERLAAKSQKFYDVTPENTISARQNQLDAMKKDVKTNIKEILQWLDEIWLNGDLDGHMTEKEYLEFRESIKYPLSIE